MSYRKSPYEIQSRCTDIDLKEMADIITMVLDDVAQSRMQEHIKDRSIPKSIKFSSSDVVSWIKAFYDTYRADSSRVTSLFTKHLPSLSKPIIVGKVMARYYEIMSLKSLSKLGNRQIYLLEQ